LLADGWWERGTAKKLDGIDENAWPGDLLDGFFTVLARQITDFIGESWVGQTPLETTRYLASKQYGKKEPRDGPQGDQLQTAPGSHSLKYMHRFRERQGRGCKELDTH
jgi:hypothetical protein